MAQPDEDVFPILVEHFTGDQPFGLGCNECGHSWKAQDVDEYISWIEGGHCPQCSSWQVYPGYEQADKCPNCGELGFWAPNECCSRACMLQAEYSKSLRE